MGKKKKAKATDSTATDAEASEVEYVKGDKEKLRRWNKAQLHWERRPGNAPWSEEKESYEKEDPSSPKPDWWVPNAYSFIKRWRNDGVSNHDIAKYYYKYDWSWSKICDFASKLRNGHLGFDRLPGLQQRYMPSDLLENKRAQLVAWGLLEGSGDDNPGDTEDDD